MKLKRKTKLGYVEIYLPSHPNNKNNYVPEHRIICEAKLGRYLTPTERVHHINSVKDDNRISNLQIFSSQKEHKSFENKVKQFGYTRPILKEITNRWKNE